MTIEKAFQRLSWRFTNGKFEPNQLDIDALKFVGEWINRQKEESLNIHTIFAKLFVYTFIHEIAFYKDLEFAQKKINEILENTCENLYADFGKRLNSLELDKYRKSIGITDKHPILMTKEENAKEEEIIMTHAKELEKYVIGIWTQEKIEKSLNNNITEAINRYKNLP
jgi:hypothetical protein